MKRMRRRNARESGFTLVELLVSLLIFGMISSAGVALLAFSVRAQDSSDARLKEIGQIRRFGALVTADLAQATPRLSRDEAGSVRPAFETGNGAALTLVRRGWENLDGANRSSLQKVQYRLSGDRLERVAYPFVDGAPPNEPVTLVSGVRGLQLRYRDKQGNWRDRWDPEVISELPRAVEMVVDLQVGGSIRQLFLVGAGA
jgi:general secretion pathway protein J